MVEGWDVVVLWSSVEPGDDRIESFGNARIKDRFAAAEFALGQVDVFMPIEQEVEGVFDQVVVDIAPASVDIDKSVHGGLQGHVR